MKDQRLPLKPHLLAEVAKGQENAAEPFKPEKLRETMAALARLGFAEMRIGPALPVDVRTTETARLGCAYLDRESIAWDWTGAEIPLDENRNPSRAGGDYYELTIRLKGAPRT